MSIGEFLTRKAGPVPYWLILGGSAAGLYVFWRWRQGKASGDPAASDFFGGPSASSEDFGEFSGEYTVTGGDGSTATMTSSGPLLTGGFVGHPGGYQYATTPGDVYVNYPPPQTTTQSVSEDTYTVTSADAGKRKGLEDIARRIWGTADAWHLLYRNNLDILGDSPNKLTVGSVLRIPVVTMDQLAQFANGNKDKRYDKPKRRGHEHSRRHGRHW